MNKKWAVLISAVLAALFAIPVFADTAQLEDSIWLYDDGERRVEAALKPGGEAEITIDEDPDDPELLACNGTWKTKGDALNVTCGDSVYNGTMQGDADNGPSWSRLPAGTETGPMREAFYDSVMAGIARLETQQAAPVEEPPTVPPEAMGEPQRAAVTDGSFNWNASGGLQIDMAFQGDMIAFDPVNGAAMKVSSGMSKAEFIALAEQHGVALDALSEDEYRVGADIFVFENDVLTRARTGF